MTQLLNSHQRRDFLKHIGLSAIPLFLPQVGGSESGDELGILPDSHGPEISVNFVSDGLHLSPAAYISTLRDIEESSSIQPDIYGNGGSTRSLEEAFARLTGKEKAIYLPTGTMANQLAIKLLSGNNTKVIVPENSHIFRDEADAAQSVHDKRLVPVGKGSAFFDIQELKNTITYLDENEVFKSGLGTVAIENPVRRADGAAVPISVIKEVSDYCREQGYKLHLDGARIHIASAFTNVPIATYASYFDTVYISLYKYLNAASGAMLCGDASFIDQIAHQIKIYGGTMYKTWVNTAVALHYLNGIEERWKQVVQLSEILFDQLNQVDGVTIESVENGTNIVNMKLADSINPAVLTDYLSEEFNIRIRQPDAQGIIKFFVNDSLITREDNTVISALKEGITKAKI